MCASVDVPSFSPVATYRMTKIVRNEILISEPGSQIGGHSRVAIGCPSFIWTITCVSNHGLFEVTNSELLVLLKFKTRINNR